MQKLTDDKNRIRSECKQKRLAMSPHDKSAADSVIFQKTWDIIRTGTDMLYCYVSSPLIEVDTLRLIDTALEKNIPIAVPRCVKGTYELSHYIITSRSQLMKGHFGIMEPDPLVCDRTDAPHDGICIVPGLAFCEAGIRMGYGKGYYDRFLENFRGLKIGLCYENCFYNETLPHDEHDAVMDMIITERMVRRISKTD